ncbi:MAG: hypothetical protein Q8O84_05290, partial [Nanoarchaeota archaeon]|nr:hypothetical protein [Nanoarchaeota archaeon]
MKTLAKILTLAGIFLTSYGVQAQSKLDTTITEYSTLKRTTLLGDSVLKKEEYTIEKISNYSQGNLVLETESKSLFEEKDLGKVGAQKNLLNSKRIDQLLIEYMSTQYKHDSLNRVIEIEKRENYFPGKEEIKKTKTYFTYEGADKNPVKVWEDLNNDGKYNQGDEIKVY